MSEGQSSVRVTMVKKKLASGEPCKKCAQAEDMLRRRDLWGLVDEVIWADETDPASPGMVLAKAHSIEIAPFFVVDRDGKREIFPSAIQVAKEVLGPKKNGGTVTAAETAASTNGAAPVNGVGHAAAPAPARVRSSVTESDVAELAKQVVGQKPADIVARVLEKLGKNCVLAFSGAEDVALIDMAQKSGFEFSVVCLDTGRLHPETYRFIDTVRQFYGIEIIVTSPNLVALEDLVRKKGLFSFYEDGHGECCGIRKVEPLRRVLSHFDGWMSGQRRDQSPTRADVPVVSWDRAHDPGGMLKANPLAELSQAEVWKYIRDNDVPYNELHDRGYVSIGCEPCTRALRPGEHERAARWWWEDATKRECGLHIK